MVEKMDFELLPALRRGEFDFVLGLDGEETDLRGLQRRVVLQEELAVVARAGHALAGRTDLGARDLAEYPWLFPMVGSMQRHVLEHFSLPPASNPRRRGSSARRCSSSSRS